MQVVQFAKYLRVVPHSNQLLLCHLETSFGNFQFGWVDIPVVPLNGFLNVASLHKIIYCKLCFENGYHACVCCLLQVIINTHLDCLVCMSVNTHVSTITVDRQKCYQA